MARDVTQQVNAAGPVPAVEDNALEVLNPDQSLTIAGREITIREYGFFEGLEVMARASAFVADMHAQCRDGELRYSRIRRLFGVHADVVSAISAQSADVDAEWVKGLGHADGDLFLSRWFAVNAGFFVHEVVVEMREDRQLADSTGTTSSSASPTAVSATSTDSDDSPSAS